MPNSQSGSQSFAALLKDIRHSTRPPETQEQLAAHLHVSRSLIAALETGGRASSSFVTQLIAFCNERGEDREAAILDACTTQTRETRTPVHKDQAQAEHGFDIQLSSGQARTVRDTLLHEVKRTTDPKTVFWMLDYLGRAYTILDEPQRAQSAFKRALQYSSSTPGHYDDEAIIAIWDKLASVAYDSIDPNTWNDYSQLSALDYVRQGLTIYPNAHRLWYRNGSIWWFEGGLLEAYSALTTALANGSPRYLAGRAQGEVLAELGRHELAIKELDYVLSRYARKLSTVDRTHVRVMRAYSRFHLGEAAAAMDDFAEIETETPHTAWLYYFRAQCHANQKEDAKAVNDLAMSLTQEYPSLTRHKRHTASHNLARLQGN